MANTTFGANAWQWIVRGWMLFLKQPAALIALSVFYVVVVFVFSYVPTIGAMVVFCLSPALFALFLYSASELEAGRSIDALRMTAFFKNLDLLLQLLVLGVVPLGVSLFNNLLLLAGLSSAIVSAGTMLLTFVAACGLLYGLPLVLFDKRAAWSALFSSLRMCAKRPFDIAVFFALSVLLAVLAAIPFGMGLLILIPLLAGAVYTSYRETKSAA